MSDDDPHVGQDELPTVLNVFKSIVGPDEFGYYTATVGTVVESWNDRVEIPRAIRKFNMLAPALRWLERHS
jgi:hypothetical protein